MAREKRGRVTPKKGSEPAGQQASQPRRSVAPRRFGAPKRIGPFNRPDASAPLGQVGRRPSSPTMLGIYAGVYFVCGIASFVFLKGSLAVIVGIVLIGLSLLWLRGAATAYLRRQDRPDP